MGEFLVSLLLFWGFIAFITGIFCFTNKKIAGKVLKKTAKNIFCIATGISLIMLFAVYINFMTSIIEMFAFAMVSSCWLLDILNKVNVKKGDVFFIKSGTVHAIGKGIVICEVQQNSNTTYRVYDYNRKDKNGITRPLHVEKALEVSSLTAPENFMSEKALKSWVPVRFFAAAFIAAISGFLKQ